MVLYILNFMFLGQKCYLMGSFTVYCIEVFVSKFAIPL
jgi:hypothetical protein